jgi:hypothetical protein
MSFIINDILEYRYFNDYRIYVGNLRNQRKFNLHDDVFIGWGDKLIKSKIVGVEFLPAENSEYMYKVTLPTNIKTWDDEHTASLNCDHIFDSVEEAKESRLNQLENKYNLEKKNIEQYFNKYANEQ